MSSFFLSRLAIVGKDAGTPLAHDVDVDAVPQGERNLGLEGREGQAPGPLEARVALGMSRDADAVHRAVRNDLGLQELEGVLELGDVAALPLVVAPEGEEVRSVAVRRDDRGRVVVGVEATRGHVRHGVEAGVSQEAAGLGDDTKVAGRLGHVVHEDRATPPVRRRRPGASAVDDRVPVAPLVVHGERDVARSHLDGRVRPEAREAAPQRDEVPTHETVLLRQKVKGLLGEERPAMGLRRQGVDLRRIALSLSRPTKEGRKTPRSDAIRQPARGGTHLAAHTVW